MTTPQPQTGQQRIAEILTVIGGVAGIAALISDTPLRYTLFIGIIIFIIVYIIICQTCKIISRKNLVLLAICLGASMICSWGLGSFVSPYQIVATQPAVNLIVNGSFETDNASWRDVGTPTYRSDKEAYKGHFSQCSVQKNTKLNQWAGIEMIDHVPIEAGKYYEFSVYLKTQDVVPASVAARPHITMTFYDANEEPVTFIPAETTPTNDWQFLRATKRAPSNAKTVRVAITHGLDTNNQPVPSSSMCIDNVRLSVLVPS